MIDDTAAEARCRDCGRECYVTDQPECCPSCGGEVDIGHGVIVRPH
jgi:Zn finger protein HypA/HybF involved in hydrogenase expression